MNQPKILFFIEGAVPSASQQLMAMQLGVPVQFRNAEWAQDGVPEPCDGVIGEVPDIYEEVPDAEDVCAQYREFLERQLDSMANEIGGKAYVPRRGKSRAQEAVPETDDDGNPIPPKTEPTETKTGPTPNTGWQGNK